MSGETSARRREAISGQPGGRAPAPGALALVQAFMNTFYDLEVDRGADLFASPGGLGDWLLARGLIDEDARVDVAELGRALTARDALRALATGRAGASTADALSAAAAGAPVELRFGVTGPRFVTAAGGTAAAAVGVILAHAAQAMIDGTWERLKICPGEHCGWAFYDHSRNRTGRWCSMSVCGGRAKARAHYRRQRLGSGER